MGWANFLSADIDAVIFVYTGIYHAIEQNDW